MTELECEFFQFLCLFFSLFPGELKERGGTNEKDWHEKGREVNSSMHVADFPFQESKINW